MQTVEHAVFHVEFAVQCNVGFTRLHAPDVLDGYIPGQSCKNGEKYSKTADLLCLGSLDDAVLLASPA